MPLIHTAHVEVHGEGRTDLQVLRREVDTHKHHHRWLVRIETKFSDGLLESSEIEIKDRAPLIAAYGQVSAEIDDIHEDRESRVIRSRMDFYIVAPYRAEKRKRR